VILTERAKEPRQWLVGVGLGFYAAVVALAPGLAAKAVLTAPLVAVPLFWYVVSSPTAWVALFFLCALLTPPLPIALGDSGPHVALLLAAVGLFIGLLRLSEWRFRPDGLSVSILGLWSVLAGSVGLAAIYSGVAIATGSLARVLLLGISVYVFLYTRDGPARLDSKRAFSMIRLLFWAGTISALFACFDFYFQLSPPAGYEPQFIWLESGVYRRAQGIFYEASTLGNLCAFFLEMIAVALLRPKQEQRFSRTGLLIGGASFAAALVLSFSRGSIVNFAVAMLVLLWLHRSRIRWGRLLAGIAIGSAGAAAILWIAFPIFASVAWLRIAAAFQYFSESPNAVLSGRVQSWQTLIDFLGSNPWHALLGVGYKTLPYSDFIGTRAIGDNTYLTLLAETGILGLLGVLALNTAILTAAYRAARSSDSLRSFCGAWMLCFWAGQAVQMFSADLLTYWRILPVYFFVLALAARQEA
jgi:O-antigen ligase